MSIFDLSELPVPAYLVGGWVRDRLLNRTSLHLDLDFVLPTKAVATARAIANRYQAGFVLLDAERQIARVVFKEAFVTADFAQQVGDSIEEDLRRRDFCMNAIAIDCQKITLIAAKIPDSVLIDPLDGVKDLKNKQVRMVAAKNLQDDPLRILRGYRQAAQLGFELEAETRNSLIEFSQGLGAIAAERVRTELSYMLALDHGSKCLEVAIKDGILRQWLPPKDLNLARLLRIDRAIAEMIANWQELAAYFSNYLSSDRSVLVVTKLAALTTSATSLTPLGLSRVEQRWLMTLLRSLPKFQNYLRSPCTVSEQYQLFATTAEIFPSLATLAIASGETIEAIAPWLNRWLDPHDPLAHQIPLLNGDDLKTELELSSGKLMGEILTGLKLAQAEGIITDRNSAIAFVKKTWL